MVHQLIFISETMFPLFPLLALVFCCTSLYTETVIPLTGTHASEINRNGYAFNIPNFDGIDVNPDGSVRYNPLNYPALPFDPLDPEADTAPGTSFNFGTITYNERALTESGKEFIPATNDMFDLDFSDYSHALGNELDIRPPTAGGISIILLDITGPGLMFIDGVPVSLNFTARVEWNPTLNGFNQTFSPYTGSLEVVNGTFTFSMSDGPQNWKIGAKNVDFEFDLIVTVESLVDFSESVKLPSIVLHADKDGVTLTIIFDQITNHNYQLESSSTLLPNSWIAVGRPFSPSTHKSPLKFATDSQLGRFFRIRETLLMEQLVANKIRK